MKAYQALLFLILAALPSLVQAQVPVINSPTTETGEVGQAFSYQIETVADDAITYGANKLAAAKGLSLDSAGLISGTPTVAGVFNVDLTASNASGTSAEVTLTITINNADGSAPVPVITSSASASGDALTNLTYQISATGNPTAFGVIGLDAISAVNNGGTITADNGLITLTQPLNTGNYTIQVSATNASGTGTQFVSIVISGDNVAPTVSYVSPTANQEFALGDTINVTVNADDSDGIVTLVQVSEPNGSLATNANMARIGTTDTYSISFTPTAQQRESAAGVFAFTVTVTDDQGTTATATQSVIMGAPSSLISFSAPTSDQTISVGASLDFSATVSSAAGAVVSVTLTQNGADVQTLTAAPFDFTTLAYSAAGTFSMGLRAAIDDPNSPVNTTITLDTPLIVTVDSLNPAISDTNFIEQTYIDIYYRTPTTTEQTNAEAALGSGTSRAQFIVDLLGTSEEQQYNIVFQEFLTLAGEWPDYTELDTYVTILGTITATDQLTTLLYTNEYDPRFGTLQTDIERVVQIFLNKHGVVLETTSRNYVRLLDSFTNAAPTTSSGSQPTPLYFSGNIISYTTRFALDNVQFLGLPGFSELLLYQFPNMRPVTQAPYAHALVGLLRVEPTNAEVSSLSAMSLLAAVQSLLDDPRYAARFPTTYTLTLTVGADGSVAVSPNQPAPNTTPDADGTGSYVFETGTSVSLTATPDAGFEFDEFTGTQPTTNANPLVFSITSDQTINASFNVLIVLALSDLLAQSAFDQSISDPQALLPYGDYDGDGRSNDLEVLTGSNPFVKDAPAYSGQVENGDVVIRYQKLVDLPEGVTVNYKYTTDITDPDSWIIINGATEAVSQPLSGSTLAYEQVKLTPDTSEGSTVYVRAEITGLEETPL